MHTPEVFPTNLRASGHSLCNVCARFSAFCSPYVIFSSLSYESIGIILCVANLCAAMAASILPETSNVALDEAVRQASVSAQESPLLRLSKNLDGVLHVLVRDSRSNGSAHAVDGEGITQPINTGRDSSL